MLICMMGIDGCGKTTQITMASQFLIRSGIAVVESKAYSKTVKPLIDPWLKDWDELAINFLFQALYTQQRIEAVCASNEGKVVLADRWDESFLVYHSLHGPLSKDRTFREALNNYAFDAVLPDLGFMFTIDPAIGKQRTLVRDRQNILDQRIDNRPVEYFAEIQDMYIELAKRRGYVIVPTEDSVEAVHAVVVSHLIQLLPVFEGNQVEAGE